MAKVLGIDLGTTNSAMTFMDGADQKLLKTPKVNALHRQLLRLHQMVNN